MSKIGDLWFGLRADDKSLQADITKSGAKAGTGFGSSMAATLKKSFSGGELGKGLVQGLGLAGGLGIANIISRLVDVAGDAVKAAREDAVSQKLLGTSLKANIPLWDGNTKAIEQVIKSRQRLGHTDEDQRDSLRRLLPVYKDINKALEVERAAMDLAAFAKISLADATTQLITIEGGQYRGLKKLIGSTKDIHNSTEALAAIRKAAGNAAEDLANTDDGKLLAAEIRQGEALEKLGYIIMPAVSAATIGLADASTGLATTLDTLANGTADTVEGQQEQLQGAIDLQRALAFLFPAFGTLSDLEQQALADSMKMAAGFDVTGDNSINMAESVKGAAFGVGGSLGDMGDAAENFRDKYRDATGDIIRRSHRMRDQLVKDAAIVRGDVFDETEIRASLHDQRLSVLALQEQRRDAKTAEAKRQASDDIVQALDDQGASLEDLAGIGALTSKDVDRFEKDAKASYGSLSKEGRRQIDLLIAKYRALAAMPNITKTFTLNTRQGSGTHPGGGGPQEFGASGGYFPAGSNVVVGEQGWEQMDLLPGGGAYITPHGASVAAAGSSAPGGSSAGNTITIYNPVPHAAEEDIGRTMRRLSALGF